MRIKIKYFNNNTKEKRRKKREKSLATPQHRTPDPSLPSPELSQCATKTRNLHNNRLSIHTI